MKTGTGAFGLAARKASNGCGMGCSLHFRPPRACLQTATALSMSTQHGWTWSAPLSGGLYRMRDGRVSQITIDGLDHDVVYSISGGKDEVWVGRQRGGLTC